MQLDRDEARAELERLLEAQKKADAEMAERANDTDEAWREEWKTTNQTRAIRIHELRAELGIAAPK